MNAHKSACMFILIFIYILGCAGNSARIKTLPDEQSKVTQQKLFDNWSDYTIWLKSTAVVFDPKDDDLTIDVGSHWGTVKDEQTWREIVNANTTAHGKISPTWANYEMTNVREIRSPDNQLLFGYVIHQLRDLVSVRIIDEKTVRLFYDRANYGGP